MAKKKGFGKISFLILFAFLVWVFRLFTRKMENVGKKPAVSEFDPSKPSQPAEITLDTAIQDVQSAVDDLKQIKGIGPKIASILHQAGIFSYQKLAETSPEELETILKDAGVRLANFHSWPNQALMTMSAKKDRDETH